MAEPERAAEVLARAARQRRRSVDRRLRHGQRLDRVSDAACPRARSRSTARSSPVCARTRAPRRSSRSTVDLARHLGLRVVAEGIETDAVLERLSRARLRDRPGLSDLAPGRRPRSSTGLADGGPADAVSFPPIRSRAAGVGVECSAQPARSPASSRARSEHGVDHRLGQPAGERVLLARVVAAEQRVALARRAPRRARSAASGGSARRRHRPARASRRSAASHAKPPRQTITRTSREQLEFAHRPRQAALALGGRGAVRRRRAAHRRRDPARRAAAGRRRDRSRSAWLAKPARASAANRKSPERSPVNMRPVRLRAVRRRREPEHEHARVRIAEARERPTPVGSLRERRAALARDLLAPGDQARAAPAVGDRLAQRSSTAIAAAAFEMHGQ